MYGNYWCCLNAEHQKRKFGKAGRNRWLGKRPCVRDVAMNLIDQRL